MRQVPPLLSFSDLLYQKLLILYPVEFRDRFSEEITLLFRDLCRDVYERQGSAGFLWLWPSALFDLIKTALEERLRESVIMTKEKKFVLSGWFLILAGISFIAVIGLAMIKAPLQVPENYNGYVLFYYGRLILLPTGFMLFGLGMFGLRARYGEASGKFGSRCLLAAGFGGFLGTSVLIGFILMKSFPWSIFLALAGFLMFAGLFLFGVSSYSKKILPRWHALPVITGIWLTFWLPISLFIDIFSISAVFVYFLYLFSALGLILMGVLLIDEDSLIITAAN